MPYVFGPRVDGDYIPDDPVTLLKEGRYHHVPMLAGTNRDEGCVLSAGESLMGVKVVFYTGESSMGIMVA